MTEVEKACYPSIIGDEATDSGSYVSLVIRFLDENITVREEFLGFFECNSGITGEALADDIL